MKKIEPYSTIENALKSLDNGGRFFNLLAKAEDGVINPSEIVKVGGVFDDRQEMMLFLEMALVKLNQAEKDTLISKLEIELQKKYRKYKPQVLLPSEAKSKGVIDSNALITGVPVLIDSTSEFRGFVIIPIMKERPNALSIISLRDDYDVYELRDEKSAENFIVAHSSGAEKLPNAKITIGGVLKEYNHSKAVSSPKDKFMEVAYYMDI
ncbi:MAG TPA: hypothetical protein VJ949_07230 [Cryomorphaceae bacterium]|nr:hypothetical protein [Cryomorphaceae bacterium]